MSASSSPLSCLDRLGPSTIVLGLDRMRDALARLGHPEEGLRVLHVAGTNGKGSTCAFAARCLKEQGYRVGLYTSPHLVRFNERIRVDGEPIPDGLLARRIEEVLARYPEAAEGPALLTYFEFGTLLALWHFAEERVDVVVLETGLGGRLDATSACRPAVTAITPISFDHMDHLGDSLAAIAGEKAGILKPGVPVVVSRQSPEALSVLEARAREVGAPLLLEGRDFVVAPEPGGTLRYDGPGRSVGGLVLSLAGPHQRQNAAVAVAALGALASQGLHVSDAAVRSGLTRTQWPGRLEEVAQGPTVVLDGAHNPGGAEVLAAALAERYPGRRVHLLFGVLADKDHGPMLRTLAPLSASVHLVAPPSPRALSPAHSLPDAQRLCADVVACPSVDAALASARSRARGNDLIVCAGSLVLVGAIRATLVGA